MAPTDVRDAYAELAEKLLQKLPPGEPAWLQDARRRGAEGLRALPFPASEKIRIASWPWTAVEPGSPFAEAAPAGDLPEAVRRSFDAGAPALVLLDGGRSVAFDLEAAEASGVVVADLRAALADERLPRYLFGLVGPEDDRLAALSAATFQGGAFVYVPRGVAFDRPVQLVVWSGERGQSVRLVVVVEAGASLELIETHLSPDGVPTVHHSVTELYVADGARLRYAALSRLGRGAVDHGRRVARVGRDGEIIWAIGEVGHADTFAPTVARLEGEGARTELYMIGVGTGEQRGVFDLRVWHLGRHTESALLAKGILLDRAHQVYNGVTKIEKKATKSSGEQTERLLILSPEARGDANPILLIEENDVKAGHAASVGRIDEGQLYYLMSRGLPRREAERLLLRAFLDPVIARVPLPAARDRLVEAIEEKIGR
ncbi:Fe-S cluster assembly protein SufD [Hydrogenibacillus schlegelii]|uniref:Iron-sulfur cluster assembly protein SufD n=1 Tax=Hydrogenibacillus schlegelii TaxID=1484 RepID=A0A179ILH7_HYDSH|nr:Fe-S cluster assembly protein SufD [Hydrogenibacillus schlegelii]OAR03526.1 hypothetical protein SA87_02460 [Hydrogenibacillus schlegelii]